MSIFRGKKPVGGTASRAEVYGLFAAAILLLGGVGGAFAYTASGGFDTNSQNTELTDTNSPTPLVSATPSTSLNVSDTNVPGGSFDQQTSQSTTDSCPYTYDQLFQFSTQHSAQQATIDSLQARLDSANASLVYVRGWIVELENGPHYHNYFDQATNSYVGGTIENLDQARNVQLPQLIADVQSLEGQLAAAKAALVPVPC